MIRKNELKSIESLKKTNGGYVYVLLADDNTVKIGITINPFRRVSQIEAASGKEIIDWTISKPCSNCFEIEKELHNHFSKSRLKGEWFNIEYSEAVKELNKSKFKEIYDYEVKDKIIDTIKAIRLCNVFAELEHKDYNYEKVKYNVTYDIPDDVITEIKNMILKHYNSNIEEGFDTDYLESYVLDINNNNNVIEVVVNYCLDYMEYVDLEILKNHGIYDLFDKVLHFEIVKRNYLVDKVSEDLLEELYCEYGKEFVDGIIRENC